MPDFFQSCFETPAFIFNLGCFMSPFYLLGLLWESHFIANSSSALLEGAVLAYLVKLIYPRAIGRRVAIIIAAVAAILFGLLLGGDTLMFVSNEHVSGARPRVLALTLLLSGILFFGGAMAFILTLERNMIHRKETVFIVGIFVFNIAMHTYLHH